MQNYFRIKDQIKKSYEELVNILKQEDKYQGTCKCLEKYQDLFYITNEEDFLKYCGTLRKKEIENDRKESIKERITIL